MESQEETLLKFPCQFPIKVMGKNKADMLEVLQQVCEVHAPDADLDGIHERPSSSGRFIGLTLVIEAQSKTQLDSIYTHLSASEAILVAL